MSASLVLRGGRVATPESPNGFVEAVAIEGDRIVALGHDDAVVDLVGPSTRVVDLAGRLAIPAFGDAHVHAVSGGLESLRCNLLGVRSRQACLDQISAYAASLPDDAWILGGGWSMETFPGGLPSASDLDAVSGGRPAFLPNRDHHSAWVNTAALERSSVDENTPDPFAGRVEHDDAGRPSGTLHDSAMALVARHLPATSPEEMDRALRAALQRLHSHGITHWQDACVGSAEEIGVVDTFDAYLRASREGWLSARVRAALWWDRAKGIEQLANFLSRREIAPEGTFRATTVKMMVDGVCETFTAAMSSAYDGEPGHGGAHRGDLFIESEELRQAVRVLDSEGFQVHFHAIGDRAITTALDALEGIEVAQRGKNRHHLAHLQFVQPSDLSRFARLGAVANFQPLWANNDPQMEEFTIPFVGAERSEWQYPIQSLLQRHARVAFGSDWPVSNPDPLQEIHVAVNRMLSATLGRPGTPETTRPFRPEEGLSIGDALNAFTKGVAYVNGDEESLGTLALGKRADLAVLSHDVFSIPALEIGDATVHLTVSGGDVVFGDE